MMADFTTRVAHACERSAERLSLSTSRASPTESSVGDARAPASDDSPNERRRRLLAAGGAGATALLAGCTGMFGGGAPQNNSTGSPSASASDPGTTTGGTPTKTSTYPEVHVNAIQYESSGNSYTFHVTLDHEGNEGGVDWWEIESLAGEKLLRKKLSSVKKDGRFNSSATVEIPDGVSAIVVRGHDDLGRYGGRVIIVNLETGDIVIEEQGAELRDFSDYTF